MIVFTAGLILIAINLESQFLEDMAQVGIYINLLLAVLNLFGYLAKEQYNTATFFIVMGLLTSFFTKKR